MCKINSDLEAAVWYKKRRSMLCDDLRGGMGVEGHGSQREGTYVYIQVSHVVQQKHNTVKQLYPNNK